MLGRTIRRKINVFVRCGKSWLGRVSLPLAWIMAKKGLKVIGFDINEEIINAVNNKTMSFRKKGVW
jgi:UDP-N-acetyl-D-mannosaminuronate dehydrogenase